ncbi:T9SS type A sorting domain-containing protein [Segetibacter sp. 3557_3]|uniref:T9SS type A sorting domain-containing protein n=1 Tax=Segetibacter sp. 3557_3 TaxID=2547429 RepID=UPI001058D24E|nr:T9SS type A sorting domain-containing protein [Segetibacter sp. 3557_3]TDH18483.1 T9SS type A sorting domain-containing protein [Segetibacter sp. 3557_3]
MRTLLQGLAFQSIPPTGTSPVYLAGSFNYSTTPPAYMAAQAYISATNKGNQDFYGELGLEFTVNSAPGITINQLGAFDDQGDGIAGTQSGGGIRVAVFDKTTRTVVPGLDAIIIGNADAYGQNYRFRNIVPVTLPQGTYVIVAKGYNLYEKNGNAGYGGGPYPIGNVVNGALSFGNTAYWGENTASGFSFPNHSATALSPNYLAGSFRYVTSTTSSDNVVTISVKDISGNLAQATAHVIVQDPDGICKPPLKTVSNISEAQDIARTVPDGNNGIMVYPNPTRGEFTVQLSNLKPGKVTLQVLNENGSVIAQRMLSVDGKSRSLIESFNLRQQPSGMYLIRLTTSSSVEVRKVIVQH